MTENENDNCVECGTPMWLEGNIGDDIPLCHSCYTNENLEKLKELVNV